MPLKLLLLLSLVFFSLVSIASAAPSCEEALAQQYQSAEDEEFFVDFEGVKFARTDRILEEIYLSHDFRAQDLLMPECLHNKKLLDAGCGGRASYVRYLRSQNIEAFGIDLNIDKDIKTDYLFNRDLKKTGFPDQSFDLIVSTWSLPSYLTYKIDDLNKAERLKKLREVLKEFERIIKVGGIIMIGDVYMSKLTLEEVLAETPYLKPAFDPPLSRYFVFKRMP